MKQAEQRRSVTIGATVCRTSQHSPAKKPISGCIGWKDTSVQMPWKTTATVALGGTALNWYPFWEAYTTGATWASFKTAVVHRFHPEVVEFKPFKMFPIVCQTTGTVGEYRERFEAFSELLNNDELFLKALFMSGLRKDVRAEPETLSHNPDIPDTVSLSEMMDRAQLMENERGRCMKLWGDIAGRLVKVTVASGVSNSLIAKRVVNELGLTVLETGQYYAKQGDGSRVKCRGVCSGVVVMRVQGMKITHDLLLFDLGIGTDVVLGVDWLTGLGPVITDYRERSMTFHVGGRAITPGGEPIFFVQLRQ